MLSITKINSASNQSKTGAGYAHYLAGVATTTKQRGDFDDYARGDAGQGGPAPFWAGKGAPLLGLGAAAEAEAVDRLARGFHPLTGEPLVVGAGPKHVMGLDMTFSAPKDVSALFAGADPATQAEIAECVRASARAALGYAENAAIVRRGHAGKFKSLAQATIAACYSHFSSRAGEPQLHVHSFFFNVGLGGADGSWSALEHRSQFERKMATGILFRAELASRMRGLGFGVEPDGPYFTIAGIDQGQRDALSSRSKAIAEYLRREGQGGAPSAAAKEIAALNVRASKAEPPLPELLAGFRDMAAELGITPGSVAAMRRAASLEAGPGAAPFAIDHAELLESLVESQSCATAHEALAAICQRAMGRWDATRCLEELDRFMAHPDLVKLGRSDLLADVFTSKATKEMEAAVDAAVACGAADGAHKVDKRLVDREFDALEEELAAKLGAPVSLDQQRAAALHIACDTGTHAFVEGWAGTGKTTMLKAVGSAYAAAGFEVSGCCQSAAASQNLARETGVPSRTIASLLLAFRNGKARLGPRSVLILDEAGMVGSREFAALQREVLKAGGKLVAVGDPKQLQPIDAGGIFRALTERYGKAEISNIQRQRTDFEPLLRWLAERGSLAAPKAKALRALPEDARVAALEEVCAADAKLGRAFARWKARYDHEWLRSAVRAFAKGEAKEALALLDERGRLRLEGGHDAAASALISDWAADKTELSRKTMLAGTRAEVADLNARARGVLAEAGRVRDAEGVDASILYRDGSAERKRFAPGDRIVFTKNDPGLGVSNGVAGTIVGVKSAAFDTLLRVELDDPNARGDTIAMVPVSFGHFDHGYCLTNHKGQGRTFDSAYVLANPTMADREWSYVAASRSRFATTLYVDQTALAPADQESHEARGPEPATRERLVEALARRMGRSRAKGTTLDYSATKPSAQKRPAAAPRRGRDAGDARDPTGKRPSLTVEAAIRFLKRVAIGAKLLRGEAPGLPRPRSQEPERG